MPIVHHSRACALSEFQFNCIDCSEAKLHCRLLGQHSQVLAGHPHGVEGVSKGSQSQGEGAFVMFFAYFFVGLDVWATKKVVD